MANFKVNNLIVTCQTEHLIVFKGTIPLCNININYNEYRQYIKLKKNQMLIYNWVILGDIFRPYGAHSLTICDKAHQ